MKMEVANILRLHEVKPFRSRRGNAKKYITVLSVATLIMSVPAMAIYNATTISELSESIENLERHNEKIEAHNKVIEDQLESQAISHQVLNDTVYGIGVKLDNIEEKRTQASRGGGRVISSEGPYKAVPDMDTSQKAYMDYRCIGAGMQLKLQKDAYTDSDGFRRHGDDYMVAMGSYYGCVGDRFQVTLSSGKCFNVIKGDAKSDRHTDSLHMHRNGNVIEFIIDTKCISSQSRRMGDMSHSGFLGTIKSIKEI